jgi:FdhE protein
VTDGPALAWATLAPLTLPDPARLFQARAARLEALARDHPAGPFLALLARVARAQDAAARALPAAAPRAGGAAAGEAARLERDPAWRGVLRAVVAGCRGAELPAAARAALARLAEASDQDLEARAGAVLAGAPDDLAAAPFVGAALQVVFTRRAAALDAGAVAPAEAECPACGSPPVAGVILGNDRSRHLCCALCATRWHLPRIRCAACQANDAISYLSIEGAPPGVRAETCDRCRSYLKLLDLQELPEAEPLADDAATIVLDLLMGERGYRRAGVNLLAPAAAPA